MQNPDERKIEELTKEFLEKLGQGSPEAVRIMETVSSFSSQALRLKLLLFFNRLEDLGPTLLTPVLKRVKGAARFLDQEDLEKWIVRCNEVLARGEIKRFVDFIRKVSEKDLSQYISPTKMRFAQIAPVLQIFLWGISGRDLALAPGTDSYTDLNTIFLPYGVNRYTSTDGNFFLYKLMTAHNWAQIETGLLTPESGGADSRPFTDGKGPPDLAALFEFFPDRNMARDIYTLLGAYMLEAFLLRELPRLWKSAKHVKAGVFRTRPFLCELTGKTAFVEGIYQYYLAGRVRGKIPKNLKRLLNELRALRGAVSSKEILEALFSFYRAAEKNLGEYMPVEPVFFLGKIEPERASEPIRARKIARKRDFEKALSKILKEGEGKRKLRIVDEIDPEREYLVRGGLVLELEGELKEIISREGEKDGWSLVKGEDLNEGEYPVKMDETPEGSEEKEFEIDAGEISYDEWDFRTGQYRKRWCLLYEQELPPGEGAIVEETLRNYKGFIKDLRKEFECLQPYPRPARRLKDGDSLDFDAVVELFIELRVGLPATGENIFSGMKSTERDIAVLFLLDMSNSTSGWVNRTEKEALIILCEGLESLGDRYGIFGFEGTSRFRCNYHRVKGFDEPYSEEVKRRIAGVEPRNYTRMGPPLRHSAAILDRLEARKKLLLVLSDGKPEDVGTYTGDYAIEDTRRALLEAKRKGIFPFCITIDKQAKSYIPHMYGEVNYIEIDDIKNLPRMMANIYRRLTL